MIEISGGAVLLSLVIAIIAVFTYALYQLDANNRRMIGQTSNHLKESIEIQKKQRVIINDLLSPRPEGGNKMGRQDYEDYQRVVRLVQKACALGKGPMIVDSKVLFEMAYLADFALKTNAGETISTFTNISQTSE